MDKQPIDNSNNPNKSVEKENSVFEEIFLDTDIKSVEQSNAIKKNEENEKTNLEEKLDKKNSISLNSFDSLKHNSSFSKKNTKLNLDNKTNTEDEQKNEDTVSKESSLKQNGTEINDSILLSEPNQNVETNDLSKYGGIYVEVTDFSETNNPNDDNLMSNDKDKNSIENSRPAHSPKLNEEFSGEPAPRYLEGMDPETGNFIRPPKLDVKVSNTNKEKTNVNSIGLDSSNLTITATGERSLRRGWSKRLVSTLSNKKRNPDDSDDEDDGADNCVFGNQIRFTVMIISTLCLSSILSNILTFNFTFICMAGTPPDNFSIMTEEEIEASGYRPDLDYSSVKRSALFMAVAVGALLAVFPLTIMLNKFGSRMVFGVLGYISAVSTYLIPLSANMGFPFILLMRIIQGIGFSACLPVMGSITSHWSTLKQNGIFIAILSSFLQVAPMFTMPISGALCTSNLGWQSVYYLHGTVCVFLFTAFIFYHRNSPNKHPLMQRTELVKVYFGKGSIYSGPGRSRKSKKVPYNAVYKDRAIWAILVAAFGNFMGTQLSLQFVPTYLNKVLFLPIEQTGITSAISPVIMFFIKLLAGQSSDRITFITDEWKLRIYNTLSMGLMGFFFIVLAMLNPYEQKSLCLCVLILSTCILGFNSGGFFKSSQMVSRQHSHFTLANISFLNCVCMLIVPLLNELIAPDNTPESWKIVLLIHGFTLIITNVFFCVFSSSRPASWTLDSWTHRAETDKKASSSRYSRRVRNPQSIAPEKLQETPSGFA